MSGIALLGMMGMLVLPLLAVAALLVYATISSSERTGLHTAGHCWRGGSARLLPSSSPSGSWR